MSKSSKPKPSSGGPFKADQIRAGDPYELSNGHPILCLPTGGKGALKTGLGAAVILSDPAVESGGIDAGFSPREKMLRAPDISVGNVPDESGWIKGVPLLAVEYADRGQDERELQEKIGELLEEGTRLIWVVRLTGIPRIEVHEKGQPVKTAGLDDELTAPGILKNPVSVRALFDREQALEVNLRNLLERHGYESLEEVKAEGKTEGTASSLLRIARKRGFTLSPELEARVMGCRDEGVLETWLDRVLAASSVEDIFC